MEEQPETPKILDELSRSNSAKPASRQQSMARKRFIVILCIFSLLIAGVGLLGYQQWMLQTRLLTVQNQNQQLSSSMASQTAEIEQLRTVQAQPVAAIPMDDTATRELEAQLNGEIARLRQQLTQLQQQIQQQSQQQQGTAAELNLEWKISEADYLLGIANQRLQLQADVTSAISLLEDADAALVASGSSAVFATRQAIAADLQLLAEVEPVDHAGIFLRLDALIGQVQSIDLLESMRDSFQSRRDAAASTASQSTAIVSPDPATRSSGFVDASLAFLSSVFVWRKWDETPMAMIAPGQDTLIKQNLTLVLEQAKLALLLRDSTLYRRSLENGLAWLAQYTAPESAVGRTMRASLDELLMLDIDPPLPALDRTLTAVKQLSASER